MFCIDVTVSVYLLVHLYAAHSLILHVCSSHRTLYRCHKDLFNKSHDVLYVDNSSWCTSYAACLELSVLTELIMSYMESDAQVELNCHIANLLIS